VPSRPCPRGRAVLEAKTARLAVMQPVKAVKMAAYRRAHIIWKIWGPKISHCCVMCDGPYSYVSARHSEFLRPWSVLDY
jgi:hypothetical protein